MALRGAPHGWGAAVSQPSAAQAALCGMRGLLAGGLAAGFVEPGAAWSLTYVVLLVARVALGFRAPRGAGARP